jgi:hypothetical protein
MGTALGPFTAEAASNVPSGSDAHRRRRRAHLTTSAPFRVRASARIRPVIQDDRRRPGHPVLVSRCLSAFASWSSCARQGPGPSLRSAYRPCCQGRTPTGLPRSARMSCGRGGCPLYPGNCGARTAGRSSPAAARRLAAARPCTPVQQPTTAGFLSPGIIKGFTVVHPSGLPLACGPRAEREPSGLSPGLHTPPSPAAHAGAGTGILGTCLSYVTIISWSSSQRNHSPRATSCRTDLLRACAPPRAAPPCRVRPQQIQGLADFQNEEKEALTNIGASI